MRASARVRGMVGCLAALLWLAALGVTPTPASAAPTIVQQKIATSATNTVTSLSVTPTTTTVGNVLVMIGANYACALLSVSGGGVTTWQRAASSNSNSNVEIWYGVVDTASSAAVVATLNTQAPPAGCDLANRDVGQAIVVVSERCGSGGVPARGDGYH